MIAAEPSESLRQAIRENEQARLAGKTESAKHEKNDTDYADRLWKGWVIPASDADTWFTAGSAAYYADLKSDDFEDAMKLHWAEYRSASAAAPNGMQQFALETHKGALFLDKLRRDMGDDKFFKLMSDYFAAHTTKTVTAQSFLDAAGVAFSLPEDKGGPMYVTADIRGRLPSAILVYGTVTDAGANRYAAEQLQKNYLDWFESAVPIRKDFEVTPDELRSHDVIFVGRPETNSALAAWKEKIGLNADGALFHIDGRDYASETDALVFAAANPLNKQHMVLVLAGNNALETVRLTKAGLDHTEYSVFESGKDKDSGFTK